MEVIQGSHAQVAIPRREVKAVMMSTSSTMTVLAGSTAAASGRAVRNRSVTTRDDQPRSIRLR